MNRTFFLCIPRLLVAASLALCGIAQASVAPGRPAAALPAPALLEVHSSFDAGGERSVALTFDACGGHFNWRLANYLVAARIPATIFVTRTFLDANPDATVFLKAHADLFEIGNHGARHLAAVYGSGSLWGVHEAGSGQGLDSEISGGSSAIARDFGSRPAFYRGATALYDAASLKEMADTGVTVAGYSVEADDGATLAPAAVMRRLAGVHPGDVVIGHINHPERPSGEGIIRGLTDLQRDGWHFLTLSEARRLGWHQNDLPWRAGP